MTNERPYLTARPHALVERWPEVARHLTLNQRYAANLSRGTGVVGSTPTLSAQNERLLRAML